MRNGLESPQEDRLGQALERLAAGESLDAILTSAGADADWLEPLLVLAAEVRDLRETLFIPSAEASLARFLAKAEHIASDLPSEPTPRRWWEHLADGLRLPAGGIPRLAGMAVSAVMAVIVLTLGGALFLGSNSVTAARNVLPGQSLYPIKRLGEEMYLWLPQSSQSRSAKSAEYEERRRDEVHMLLDRHLEARVAFRGVVETLSASRVVVSDIPLQMMNTTQIEGPLAIGAQVWVEARTVRDGTLIAERVVVERPGQPTVAPSPTATPQPTATPRPTVTPTVTPSATPTSTATPTPTLKATPTPQPTPTPTVAPTETPTPAPTATREPTATATPTLVPTEEIPEPLGGGDDDGGGDDNDNGDNGDNSNGDGGDHGDGDDGSGDGNGDGDDNSNDDSGDNDDGDGDGSSNDDGNDSGDGDDDSSDSGDDDDDGDD